MKIWRSLDSLENRRGIMAGHRILLLPSDGRLLARLSSGQSGCVGVFLKEQQFQCDLVLAQREEMHAYLCSSSISGNDCFRDTLVTRWVLLCMARTSKHALTHLPS